MRISANAGAYTSCCVLRASLKKNKQPQQSGLLQINALSINMNHSNGVWLLLIYHTRFTHAWLKWFN